jgi:hypothetical protein
VFAVVLFLVVQPQVNKKPTTVASRGFLSKLVSASTSANGGVAYDDDQQSNLSNY